MRGEAASPKALLASLRDAMREWSAADVRVALDSLFAPDALIRLAYPFGDFTGAVAYYDGALAPLFMALPDLERRDHIVISGVDQDGAAWVGCCGCFVGTFVAPFLDIAPTGHVATMRFHEFYRFEGDHVVEMQVLWDIPELMMQAGVWPMAPSLGREAAALTPLTQDGLSVTGDGQGAVRHVLAMLEALIRHPAEGGPEVMELERFWHPKFMWYGPAGIGTARGVRGFRNWHQIPFLAAMPDRGQYPDAVHWHFFGEGDYAAVTGWPNMVQTLSAGGWLGIAPAGKIVSLRSLDFWRLEHGLIRENWVLVDLLDLYAQVGVDVLDRMRAFNKARTGFDPETGRAL